MALENGSLLARTFKSIVPKDLDLSPFKVCLFVAVDGYIRMTTDAPAPKKSGRKVNKNDSSVLSAADDKNASAASGDGDGSDWPKLEAGRRRTALMIILDMLDKEHEPFQTFSDRLLEVPEWHQRVVNRIHNTMDRKIDGLCDIFKSDVLTHIEKQTLLGQFLRRIFLWFDRACFTEIITLNRKLAEFVSGTQKRRRNGRAYFTRSRVNATLQDMIGKFHSGSYHFSDSDLQLLAMARKTFPDLLLLHLVDCHAAIQSKNFAKAIECLHSYFEEQLPDNGHSRTSIEAVTMTRLCRKFGYLDMARNSLAEAVRLCEEIGDTRLLQTCMLESYLLEDPHNTDPERSKQLLQQLLSDAKSQGYQDIASLVKHSLAKLEFNDESDPNESIETIFDCIGCCADSQGPSSAAGGSTILASPLRCNYGLAMLSSAYLRLGDYESSSLYAQEILALPERAESADSIALCNLAQCLAVPGRVEEALALLNDSDSAEIHLVRHLVAFRKHLLAGEFDAAKRECDLMAPFSVPESVLREAELLITSGELVLAVGKLNDLLKTCEEKSVNIARCCSLLAQAHLLCASVGPAFTYLEQGLAVADQSALAAVEHDLTLVYAGILLKQGDLKEAWEVVTTTKPLDPWEECRVAFLRAQALCLQAKQNKIDPDRNIEYYSKSVDFLQSCVHGFQQFNATFHLREAHYLLAFVLDKLGDRADDRNHHAMLFNQLDGELRDRPKYNTLLSW